MRINIVPERTVVNSFICDNVYRFFFIEDGLTDVSVIEHALRKTGNDELMIRPKMLLNIAIRHRIPCMVDIYLYTDKPVFERLKAEVYVVCCNFRLRLAHLLVSYEDLLQIQLACLERKRSHVF